MNENPTTESKITASVDGEKSVPEKTPIGKPKKKAGPVRIVLTVFCSLVLLAVLGVCAVFARVMIIEASGYSVMEDGLVLDRVLSKDIEEDGSFTVPKSFFGSPVIRIGESAFEGQTELKRVVIPDTVTYIYPRAFAACYSLEEVVLPSTVEEIGINAFFACTSLKEICIPEGVTAIGEEAFFQCTALEYITLPSTLTYIGDRAFRDCSALKEFRFSAPSESFVVSNGDLYTTDMKKLIRYAAGDGETVFTLNRATTHIFSYAFDSCTNLTNIRIHFDVFIVQEKAFTNMRDALISIEGPQRTTGDNWATNWNDTGCMVFWNSIFEEEGD